MIESVALSYAHPGAPAIVFPDVSLPQGASLLLTGRSGSGKSTWLALVSGLLTPAAGSLVVAGRALSAGASGHSALQGAARDAWRAATIGLLPQRLFLSEALTVQQNLELPFFASGRPVDAMAVQQALAALELEPLRQRKPSQLSGGQAQRVALARATLLQPRVLLADEPTASLDDDNAQRAVQLLQRRAQECGATLVIATHDARVAPLLPQAWHLQVNPLPQPNPEGAA